MGLFDKLRDLKFEIEMKATDIRYAVSDKFDDVKDFVEDKVDDVKYYVGDKVDDVKYYVGDKVDDLKYFVEDKVDDVKDFAEDKLKIKSKGDVAEIASYVLFPQQIPLKFLMSSIGKGASANIQSKNDKLLARVEILEGLQEHGEELDKKIQQQLTTIQELKTALHSDVEVFAKVFEKIHNRPTYTITTDGLSLTFDDLFDTTATEADFARFDSYLLNIYDEDAGILQGLLRTPVFAAILKFREKALLNKIDNVLEEVNNCIENMEPLVQYLSRLHFTSSRLSKELSLLEPIVKKQIDKLAEVVEVKTDFNQFSKHEITILDTTIKHVRIIVSLMNTHIFNPDEQTTKGLAKINTKEVVQVVKESETIRELI
ncbi:hypothetical protein ACLM5H_16930 [Fredinandcohnia humi]